MIHDREICLKYVNGKPRLMGITQANANMKANLVLNDVGAFIWRQFDNDVSLETVVNSCLREFSDVTYDEAYAAVKNFSDLLFRYNVLYERDLHWTPPSAIGPRSSFCKDSNHSTPVYVEAGGISLCIYAKKSYISNAFDKFIRDSLSTDDNHTQEVCLVLEDTSADSYKTVSAEEAPFTPCPPSTALYKRLFQRVDIEAYESNDCYYFIFPINYHITRAILDKSGKYYQVYYTDKPSAEPKYTRYDVEVPDLGLAEEFFCASRMGFLYLAELNGLYAIHSSSILYKDRAWLFSAHTGIGKTTHTNLWVKAINVPILNGDLCLLGYKDNVLTAYGLPWCGTSEVSIPGEHPLGGIIFIKQNKSDYTEDLSIDDKVTMPLHRIISPMWAESQLDSCLEFCHTLPQKILIARLNCTINKSAYEASKSLIDKYVDGLTKSND